MAEQQSIASVSDFWIRVMEQLNASADIYSPIPQVLNDTCAFFGFGCGFIYEANHTNTFFLRESYQRYDSEHLKESIDMLETLGDELLDTLIHQKAVMFTGNTTRTPLDDALANLFHANSMVLIPITNRQARLIAFVGLLDRRGSQREQVPAIDAAYAVLCAIANHVKLHLFQNQVESTDRAMRSMVDHMGIDVYVNDFYTHEILYLNQSMAAPYGGAERMLGKNCWEALYDDKDGQCEFCPQTHLLDEDGNPSKVYSWDYQRPFDNSWFRVFSAAFRWTDGRLAHVVSSVDITANKRNELLIRQMADYDTLTGLPNRRKLMADMETNMHQMGVFTKGGYLIFFDLDGFKKVNDTLGHRAGDELLSKIGDMLQSNSVTEGRSYRHGGDEFVVLCDKIDPEHFKTLLNSLLDIFSQAWKLEDGDVVCRASLGIVHFPTDDDTVSGLLHKADEAMYHAKRAGKGKAYFYNRGDFIDADTYFKEHATE